NDVIFVQPEDGIRDRNVTGVQTCALPISDEEVKQAAIAANAHEFIECLPLKYDTLVGERGVKLSGGQQQRVAIARVFLKNPPILIFDEATSALDLETEQSIQLTMEKLASERTTFI